MLWQECFLLLTGFLKLKGLDDIIKQELHTLEYQIEFKLNYGNKHTLKIEVVLAFETSEYWVNGKVEITQ